ncbi:hypothetical protein P4U99_18585 [Brevibacillus agri]|uniref:hypothetical protein n=1 Tax=Brevibacillus agri TaxID=51101 RepID=UPI0025B65B16|nr:hypothetical protein [Brevibacillus agri]MDN4091931.1 hypothetical protein [Brevibacillus agri]MED1645172.1 hypothetical protein [Brevibacillus agri]MED1657676.1 hypothetical protein [Brevibacillus agri]MED1689758.1 hypothetical protein [Brevibacillus agri]MED1693824.1 hypothetical protein [Brevibacillus agri]
MSKSKSVRTLLVIGTVLLHLTSPALARQAAEPGQMMQQAARQQAESEHNRYEVAGITDPVAFEAFFDKLQEAVKAGNKAQVARMVQYPLRINKDGGSRYVQNEQQFLAEYDEIVTPKVKEALLAQNVRETFVNAQGVMVGNGELWLGQSGGKYVWFAVNL